VVVKREDISLLVEPKLDRPRPALGAKPIKKRGIVPSVDPVVRFSVNHAPNVMGVRKAIAVHVACNKHT
jgi:hypothetical protein